MARPPLAALICGAGSAVLVAAGGCGGAVEEAVDAGAVARPADQGAPPDDGRPGERAGSPGSEVSAGGTAGRPGAPFDQPVFQDRGRDFDDAARRSIEERCADVCTVGYAVAGDPDDPSQECRISDFTYEPADRGGFFQAGTEVTVHVTCEG